MVGILLFFIGVGLYSMLTHRAQLVEVARSVIIEKGRFSGEVTGYETNSYLFMVVPILLLVLSKSRAQNIIGWLAAGLFLLLALPNGWDRFALVSMLLALSIVDCLKRRSGWPRWFLIPIIFIFAVAMQLRGHETWTLQDVGDELAQLSGRSVQNVGTAIGSVDSSMLATWYLESYIVEEYLGYSYGLPVINYALTGWIPSRIMPDKYFLVDRLNVQRPDPGVTANQLLRGAKSSLMGSFYAEGWLVGVVFMSALAGFLSRKLDAMLSPESPLLVRATGVAWMSVLWMIWGSADYWAVMTLGILALPAIVVWVVAPKESRKRKRGFAARRVYAASAER
jgi:hypothetical protein